MNKLFEINKNFREFVQVALDSIKINQIVHNGLDKVLSTSELKEIVDEVDVTKIKEDNTVVDKIDEISEEETKKKCISINSDFTGKSPNCIRIKGNNIEISSMERALYRSL